MEEKDVQLEEEVVETSTVVEEKKESSKQPSANNPKSHNKFIAGLMKVLVMFWTFTENVFYDFYNSFKYNKMKLPGLLVAVPGIFLGFLLSYHAPVVKSLAFGTAEGKILDFDFSAIALFLLVLLGILNIFTAANMIGKKNLGSVVTATITTTLLVISGILYLYVLMLFMQHPEVSQGKITNNFYISIASVIVSMVAPVIGVILGYIFYDRDYKKVDR